MILNYLNKLPLGKITELIGTDIQDGLTAYNLLVNRETDQGVAFLLDNSFYSNLLIERFGNQLLVDKKNNVLKTVLTFALDDNNLKNKIFDELKISRKIKDLGQFLTRNFGNKNPEFSIRLLSILGIDSEFYLPKEDLIENRRYVSDQLTPQFPLHKFQKLIKDKVVRVLFRDDANRLLIHLPTGAGKTKTAVEIMCDYIRSFSIVGALKNTMNIAWIAHNNELCDQALETFSRTWQLRGDTDVVMHRIYGDVDLPENINTNITNIFVIGFPKFVAIKRKINDNAKARYLFTFLAGNIDLTIIDEAHKSIAPEWLRSVQEIITGQSKKLIGLTATPGRNIVIDDIENQILRELYGGVKISLMDQDFVQIEEPISFLQDEEYLAEIEEVPILTDVEIKLDEIEKRNIKRLGENAFKRILADLTINPRRNDLIINSIFNEYKENNQILVFACSVDHCYIIKAILNAHGIVSEVIDSSTPKIKRNTTLKKFLSGELKILLNYEVLSTGFDHPGLKSLMIARPTSSIVLYSQMIGRVIRGPKNQGLKNKRLITIKDNISIGGQRQIFGHFDEVWKANN